MLVGEVRCATTASGILLDVVGRQPVVLGVRDERLEVAPGLARDAEQERAVARRRASRRARATGRLSP